MVLEKFTKINIKEQLLARLQLNLERYFFQLTHNPLLRGQLVSDVSLGTTPRKINHSIGVAPIGFLVIDRNTNATIYSNDKDQAQITLTASGACTASLWIF